MSNSPHDSATPRRPLRLWPGVAIVSIQLVLQFVVPAIFPDALIYGVLGGALGGVLVLGWGLLFSRAAWIERLGAVVLVVASVAVTRPFLDRSIATGAMG